MFEFEKLLISPFFNNHSTIIKLFCELKKYYPEFSDKKITKEYLFNVVNKGRKYDDKLFRKYLSRINKLAEEYLNIIEIRSHNDKVELNILSQLSKRDLKEAYSKKLKKVEKSFEKDNKIDGARFFLKHQFSEMKYNHKSTGNNIVPNNEDLTDSFDNLINYFLFFSSSLLNQIDSNHYSFSSEEDENPLYLLLDKFKIEEYIDDIKKIKTNGSIDRNLFLEIVLNDVKMNSAGPGLQAFKNLNALVYGNLEKFSDRMLYYLLQRMNVFCILESAKGNDMNTEIFENYKILLEKDLFNIEGEKTPLTLLDFRQILSSALKNNAFEWAEKFIKDKLHLVKEDLRINTFNYGSAVLSFNKKKYTDALAHISKIKSESLPITTDIYVLKAKIFYLLGHFDSALDVANSFRHYVTGNKLISDFHKETFLNFLKYYKVILRLTVKKDKIKLNMLLDEIKNSYYTKEKKWMIETINALPSD